MFSNNRSHVNTQYTTVFADVPLLSFFTSKSSGGALQLCTAHWHEIYKSEIFDTLA
jgi:hypothetical protein